MLSDREWFPTDWMFLLFTVFGNWLYQKVFEWWTLCFTVIFFGRVKRSLTYVFFSSISIRFWLYKQFWFIYLLNNFLHFFTYFSHIICQSTVFCRNLYRFFSLQQTLHLLFNFCYRRWFFQHTHYLFPFTC